MTDKKKKKCLLCDYTTSTKTSNLTSTHFPKVHTAIFNKVEAMLEKEKKLEDEVASWLVKEVEKVATANAMKNKNSKLTAFFQRRGDVLDPATQEKVRPLILTALLIASAHTPILIVENEYFRALTGVHLSRRQITRIIRVVANMCRDNTKRRLANFKMISVTGDGYSALQRRAFQSVTAHGLDNTWDRGNFVLAVEAMTGKIDSARIAAYTRRVVDDFTDDDTLLGAMTTDGAEAAVSDALVGVGNGVTCFAHTLQLVVHAGIDSGGFKQAIERIRNLIVFCRASRPVREALRATLDKRRRNNKDSKRRK